MASEKTVLPIPPPPTTFKDDPRATLSTNEQTMYDEVLAHFTKQDPVYGLPNVENGELKNDEKFWLSRECLLRYLRATKWKSAGAAITRLETTLKWRRDFGLYDLVNAAHVEPEAVTGKEILFGYDIKGKPAFYMIPSRQNTDEAKRQIDFAVWMLERSVDLMEPGVETIALLINFADKAKNPSMSTARTVLNILQEHYPERLGLALVINVPFLVNAFFKLITPFIDPVTREKLKFNPQIIKDGLFTPDMVMKEWWGGDQDFEYIHEQYWAALTGLCDDRVKTWKKNWRELGAKVGVSEWDYKNKGFASKPDVSEERKEKEVVAVAVVTAAPELDTAVDSAADEPSKKADEPVVATSKSIDPPVPAQPGKENTATTHTETSAATGGHTAVAGGAVAGGETGGGGGGGDAGGDAGGDGGGE